MSPERTESSLPADRPAAPHEDVSPQSVRSWRSQLTSGGDVVDPETWAGAIPQAGGIAPRVRIGQSRWFNLLWLLPLGLLLLMVAVAVAQGLRSTPSVQRFIAQYPGTVEPPG
ncbi:MAG: hypothetical protein M3R48_04045, partial [Candidatus Dormibacteraeota bacterium]|nr:hypothetical protein [Candidatus Dormibacteraeota bacterium]